MAELMSMRLTYGQTLVELGKMYPDMVVLSADVSNSDHSFMFEDVFPERFVNVGIAEQCLVDVAVGLAYCGKIPFANTFAFLHSTRALEMIRTHVCYGEANVKLMGAYAGLSDSYDGPTHQSIIDLAIMRSLPNMSIVEPSDPIALNKLLYQVVEWPGPVYVRMNRNEVPVLFDENYSPTIGKAELLREGSDVTLMCAGVLVPRCLEAAKILGEGGIEARVLELHTIKPIDEDLIQKAAKETGAIVTAEEHSIIGGLGSAVAEVVSTLLPVPIRRIGIVDTFTETGPYDALLDKYGMAVEDIIAAAEEIVAAKNG
jgi:transketolase